ncbi:hypothetical protein BBJ28_00021274 [Nothophytophthora sp. Chile5]|nr:hypothetical protein BBJ28_00021274 [Nothophytophthora sp. Chile5]
MSAIWCAPRFILRLLEPWLDGNGADGSGTDCGLLTLQVKERGLHSGRDEDFDCFVLDEDKVCDEMEEMMAEGGKLVDFHTCDFFPERWFDLVVVLRTDNTTLFDRLQKRGYSDKKVSENVECEIMQVVLQEARESYAPEIVQELPSLTVEDMDSNIERVLTWLQHWMAQHSDD